MGDQEHQCNTNQTQAIPMRHEYDASNTSATRTARLQHKRKALILLLTRVKTYFHTSMLAIYERKITNRVISMPNAFINCTTKSELCNGKSCFKKLYILDCSSKCPYTFSRWKWGCAISSSELQISWSWPKLFQKTPIELYNYT